MRKISLQIPTRILYNPGTVLSTGFPSSGGFNPDTGTEFRWAFYVHLDGFPVDIDMSYMESQRAVGKHSWCLHASPVSPPDIVSGNIRFLSLSGNKELRRSLTSGRQPLAAGQEVTDHPGPIKDWRNWKYLEWTNSSWSEYTCHEYKSTLAYDTYGISGKHPYYVSQKVVFTELPHRLPNGSWTYEWWAFQANVSPYPSMKFQPSDYYAWINMVNRVAQWDPNVMGETDYYLSIPYQGSVRYSWKRCRFTGSLSNLYVYQLAYADFPILDAGMKEPMTIGKSCRSSFKFSEPGFVKEPSGHINLINLDLDQAFQVKQLQSEAFLKAAEDIPRMNDNTFQIIIDLIKILRDIAKGDFSFFKSIPKTWQDIWLSKRYSIDTNVMDYRQIAGFLRRMQDQKLFASMYCKGSATINGVTCWCHFRAKSVIISKLQECLYVLDRFGLCPDFYIIWDSIPYSFIVDWVAPIGDAVSRTDAQIRYSNLNYEYEFISYSLQYRVAARLPSNLYSLYGNLWVECYSRWYEYSTPRSLMWAYQYSPASKSTLTWTKRGLDIAAIIT